MSDEKESANDIVSRNTISVEMRKEEDDSSATDVRPKYLDDALIEEEQYRTVRNKSFDFLCLLCFDILVSHDSSNALFLHVCVGRTIYFWAKSELYCHFPRFFILMLNCLSPSIL